MNIKLLKELIKERYVTMQKHPTENLYIYNYTEKAQYDKMWNEITLNCRGLIMDGQNNVIARPFPKFFNLEELKEIPNEKFEIYDKLDGSLGISYRIGEEVFLATRGSFTSDQALRGTAILKDKYPGFVFVPGYTYLFEIIYPENRIVVNYNGMEDLILLTVIETETGREVPHHTITELHAKSGIPIVRKFEVVGKLEEIREKMSRENAEGYVVRFSGGTRIKIKFEEYVRLHRLVTGVTVRRIWELLRNGDTVDEMLDRVPDEFYRWVKDKKKLLEQQYKDMEKEAKKLFNKVKKMETRKEQALWLKENTDNPAIVFRMLDGKKYDAVIWGLLRPPHELPFTKII